MGKTKSHVIWNQRVSFEISCTNMLTFTLSEPFPLNNSLGKVCTVMYGSIQSLQRDEGALHILDKLLIWGFWCTIWFPTGIVLHTYTSAKISPLQ